MNAWHDPRPSMKRLESGVHFGESSTYFGLKYLKFINKSVYSGLRVQSGRQKSLTIVKACLVGGEKKGLVLGETAIVH